MVRLLLWLSLLCHWSIAFLFLTFLGFRLLVTLLLLTSQTVIAADTEMSTVTNTSTGSTYSLLKANHMTIEPANTITSGARAGATATTCDAQNSSFQRRMYNVSCATDNKNLTTFGNLSQVEQSVQDFQAVLQRFDCWCPPPPSPEEDGTLHARKETEGGSGLYVTYSHRTSCQQCLVRCCFIL